MEVTRFLELDLWMRYSAPRVKGLRSVGSPVLLKLASKREADVYRP